MNNTHSVSTGTELNHHKARCTTYTKSKWKWLHTDITVVYWDTSCKGMTYFILCNSLCYTSHLSCTYQSNVLVAGWCCSSICYRQVKQHWQVRLHVLWTIWWNSSLLVQYVRQAMLNRLIFKEYLNGVECHLARDTTQADTRIWNQ